MTIFNKPKRVNAPEGFNQVFSLKHLFNGKKWILLRACYEMSLNSMMYHDEIHIWLQCWLARQQQEQIQNKSEKRHQPIGLKEQSRQIQNKFEKSMVKWPKIWWNSKIQRDFTMFWTNAAIFQLPFSTKADMFRHAFFKPCRIFLNPAIPSLFHHAFAAHFTMICPTLVTSVTLVSRTFPRYFSPR